MRSPKIIDVLILLLCSSVLASGPTEEPIAKFRFESGAGGEAVIASALPNAKLEVFGDGPAAKIEPDSPIPGEQSLSFESAAEKSGAYLDTGMNQDLLSVQQSFSISVWFQLRKPDRTDCLVSIADNDQSVFQLTSWSGVIRASIHSSNGEEGFASLDGQKLQPGKWHHIAVVYDSDNGLLSVYLDDLPAKTTPITFQPSKNPGNWIVGVDRGGNGAADMLIGGLQFFRAALAPEDVQSNLP